MENILLVGLSRQVALGRELDVIANNIANLNTTGFKADGTVFEEYLASNARGADFSGRDARISFVHDRATWHDLSQGAVEVTSNPLDLAIQGRGYLAVQTPRGERYTRNGALQVSAAGELVTSEGYQVLGENGPIVMQPTDRDIMIAGDGTISVKEGSNALVSALRGKLRLVNFTQPERLEKDGAGTFNPPNGMQAQADPNSRVIQGSIEKSNVRGVAEMTRMIDVTRSYTQVASLLQQQGDLRQNAIQKLSDVPN